MPRDRDAAWESDEDSRSEAERPLYRDPFDDPTPCRRILTLPEEVRARVARSCPRCGGREPESWVEAGRAQHQQGARCILEGVDLDLLAYDDEEALRALRARLSAGGPAR